MGSCQKLSEEGVQHKVFLDFPKFTYQLSIFQRRSLSKHLVFIIKYLQKALTAKFFSPENDIPMPHVSNHPFPVIQTRWSPKEFRLLRAFCFACRFPLMPLTLPEDTRRPGPSGSDAIAQIRISRQTFENRTINFGDLFWVSFENLETYWIKIRSHNVLRWSLSLTWLSHYIFLCCGLFHGFFLLWSGSVNKTLYSRSNRNENSRSTQLFFFSRFFYKTVIRIFSIFCNSKSWLPLFTPNGNMGEGWTKIEHVKYLSSIPASTYFDNWWFKVRHILSQSKFSPWKFLVFFCLKTVSARPPLVWVCLPRPIPPLGCAGGVLHMDGGDRGFTAIQRRSWTTPDHPWSQKPEVVSPFHRWRPNFQARQLFFFPEKFLVFRADTMEPNPVG